MTPPPITVNLWLCEGVVFDSLTGRPSLINVFSTRRFAEFPTEPVSFSVFSRLTDGRGRGTMRLELWRLDEESWEEVYRVEGDIVFRDPLEILNVAIPLSEVSFPAPASYQFVLSIDDQAVASHGFDVAAAEDGR
jgi:hypothetical protein